MKITKTNLIDKGNLSSTNTWQIINSGIEAAIQEICWPDGLNGFGLNPVKKGNGVTSLKPDCDILNNYGWQSEKVIIPGIGPIDYLLSLHDKKFVLEWETGNIASSYRAMSKINHALLKGLISGAVVVIPTKQMAQFLTDRISSFEELEPHFDLWRATPCLKDNAVLEVWSIEYDYLDATIPLLAKARTGRNHRCRSIHNSPIFLENPSNTVLT